MLGEIDTSQKTVHIIGAGISGLLAAYHLAKSGYDIHIYDKSTKTGGLIQSEQGRFGLVEKAAHSFKASPSVRRLCDELGVELCLLNNRAKARYIVRNNRLRKLPLSLIELLILLKNCLTKKSDGTEKTLSDWGREHLGAAANRYLLDPISMGIYGTSADQLTIPAAFKSFEIPHGTTLFQHLKTRKKLSSRPAPMASPKGGMQQLIDALTTNLKGKSNVTFHLGKAINSLPKNGNIVLCAPAPIAAKLTKQTSLNDINYSPLMAATVFIDKAALTHIKPALGLLIPPSEGYKILGILFNSSSFDNRTKDNNLASLSVFIGGTIHPELHALSHSQLDAIIIENLQRLLRTHITPESIKIARHQHAIPCYNSALNNAIKDAKNGWCSTKGRILFGNYTGDVSLRGLIESAEKLA